MLDPGADLRRYENEARVGGNVASLQRYAEELTRQGRYDEAIAQYRKALTGLYEHDPNIMLGIAQAQFGKGDPSAARQTLDDLIRLNPDFRSPQGHLLYARALEGEGNVAKALDEYKVLATSYPGAEAGARYAQLLKSQGKPDDARKVAQEMLEASRIAPAHYQARAEGMARHRRADRRSLITSTTATSRRGGASLRRTSGRLDTR